MKYLLLFMILFCLVPFACKKENDGNRPCAFETPAYVTDRYIPDSVSIDSSIIIGALWKKTFVCQNISGFMVDTVENNCIRIHVQTLVDPCSCDNGSPLYRRTNYVFKPGTTGKYPIRLTAFYEGYFVDTVVVY
jgi:hypothetical protein